ncbi:MAG: MerR family transcriptional regulator [Proteobacteria bacterium]|nr:MerR family transcriptional regulator [Pseudomonadota bacterium]
MPDHLSLSLYEVADKLNIGETTLNVWRNRYRKWLPTSVDAQGRLYPETIVEVFRFISKCTHAGMDTQEIERALEAKTVRSVSDRAGDPHPEGVEQTRVIIEALKESLAGMFGQQQRIADAQERRATAEERKAYAMESQAESEQIKANALRDMVSLIQDLAEKDSVSALMDKVKRMPAPSPSELEDFTMDMPYVPDHPDDLPELIDTQEPELMDDFLGDVGKETLDTGELEAAPGVDTLVSPRANDVDDLSLLIEDEVLEEDGIDFDDLSLLLEPGDIQDKKDIDDLSLLIEEEGDASGKGGHGAGLKDVDDLSKLIDTDDGPKDQVQRESQPRSKVDESYKSKILKRIIRMKQQDKLSIEETTRQFNEEGVRTLSGKGKWDSKTIQGIYKYIDSVQGS